MLNFNTVAPHQQIPLIHVINEDDELLANSPEAEWYQILKNLPWEQQAANILTYLAEKMTKNNDGVKYILLDFLCKKRSDCIHFLFFLLFSLIA